MANILLIHQNFPGQFKHLAPALVARGHSVRALHLRDGLPERWQGVQLHRYAVQGRPAQGLQPWLVDMESKLLRGQSCLVAMRRLREAGFMPDVVLAHPGWGESLFAKDVWPQARLALYAEFFYRAQGGDVGFDPEFLPPDPLADAARLRVKNANNLLHLDAADALISPTRWQASTFPDWVQERMTVVHDGIDTDALVARPEAQLSLPQGTVLRPGDEVVTFVSRNLEPYRGYHSFMRALPALLQARPQAQVLLIGGDQVSYGAAAPGGQRWKDIFAGEVRPALSEQQWARVHFLGRVPYDTYLSALQVSAVLSWSLLEAMSLQCTVVGSDTAPVREVITHGAEGVLVNFFNPAAIAAQVAALLGDAPERERLGRAARERMRREYDLQRICLPRQLAWLEGMVS